MRRASPRFRTAPFLLFAWIAVFVAPGGLSAQGLPLGAPLASRGFLGMLLTAGDLALPDGVAGGHTPAERAAAFLRLAPTAALPPDILDLPAGGSFRVSADDGSFPDFVVSLSPDGAPTRLVTEAWGGLYALTLAYDEAGRIVRLRSEFLGPITETGASSAAGAPQERTSASPSSSPVSPSVGSYGPGASGSPVAAPPPVDDGSPARALGAPGSSPAGEGGVAAAGAGGSSGPLTLVVVRGSDGLPVSATLSDPSGLVASAAFSFSGSLDACSEVVYGPDGVALALYSYRLYRGGLGTVALRDEAPGMDGAEPSAGAAAGSLPDVAVAASEAAAEGSPQEGRTLLSFDYGPDGLPWRYASGGTVVEVVYGTRLRPLRASYGADGGIVRVFQWDENGRLVRESVSGGTGATECRYEYLPVSGLWTLRRAQRLVERFGVLVPSVVTTLRRVSARR